MFVTQFVLVQETQLSWFQFKQWCKGASSNWNVTKRCTPAQYLSTSPESSTIYVFSDQVRFLLLQKQAISWNTTNLSQDQWSKSASTTKQKNCSWSAKLHTATSSGEVYSMISLHKLEQWMVPKFCWLDLRLAWSWNSINSTTNKTLQNIRKHITSCYLHPVF